MGFKQLDTITKDMGFPVGSATLVDEVGIDVGAHIGEYLGGEFGERIGDAKAMSGILNDLVSNGFLGMPLMLNNHFIHVYILFFSFFVIHAVYISIVYLGRKSGKGLYVYEMGSKDRPENPGAVDLLKKYKAEPRVP